MGHGKDDLRRLVRNMILKIVRQGAVNTAPRPLEVDSNQNTYLIDFTGCFKL